MHKIIGFLSSIFFLLSISFNTSADNQFDNLNSKFAKYKSDPKVRSAKAMVVNQNNGKVIYQKNAYSEASIASLTKLMTAMVILDSKIDLNKKIKISKQDIDRLKGTGSRIPIGTSISGYDLLKESEANIQNKINVYKRYDFGKATLVVAIPDPWIDVQTVADLEEIAFEFKDKKKKRLRVATKYPNLTREFLFSKGVTQFKLVGSLGATEAYPFTGSSEIITDISSTGETLKANNLRVLKDGEILESVACMMISKSSVKKPEVKKLVKLLSKN